MATLPTALALTNVATGAPVLSADHRNNYSALQTALNSLIATLGTGAAGQVFKGAGTTVSYAYPPGYEYGYTEFTAPVSVTATTEATANTVVTASAVTFDGSTIVLVEFFAPDTLTPGANAELNYVLYDGAASVGKLARTYAVSGAENLPIRLTYRLTPAAAAKTYSVRAYVSSGTGSVSAGAGGIGNYVPGFIRITKV